eukprot:SAG11_NODE_2548_length_3231_cov_14.685504_2_plen_264_part_00
MRFRSTRACSIRRPRPYVVARAVAWRCTAPGTWRWMRRASSCCRRGGVARGGGGTSLDPRKSMLREAGGSMSKLGDRSLLGGPSPSRSNGGRRKLRLVVAVAAIRLWGVEIEQLRGVRQPVRNGRSRRGGVGPPKPSIVLPRRRLSLGWRLSRKRSERRSGERTVIETLSWTMTRMMRTIEVRKVVNVSSDLSRPSFEMSVISSVTSRCSPQASFSSGHCTPGFRVTTHNRAHRVWLPPGLFCVIYSPQASVNTARSGLSKQV